MLHMCAVQGSNSAAAQSSNLGALLQHATVGPQLQRLSFAYSSCLLCVEGDSAFEFKMAEQLSKLYAMARHSGVSLQYLFSPTQAMTEVCQPSPYHISL